MRNHLEAEFECVPESVRAAREFVRAALDDWGLDDADGTVTLLTSEVATNVVVHARTSYILRLEYQPPTILVRVEDGSTRRAERRCSGAHAEAQDGRGLLIVDELSDAWGSRRWDRGKEVWFALDFPVPLRRHAMAGAGHK